MNSLVFMANSKFIAESSWMPSRWDLFHWFLFLETNLTYYFSMLTMFKWTEIKKCTCKCVCWLQGTRCWCVCMLWYCVMFVDLTGFLMHLGGISSSVLSVFSLTNFISYWNPCIWLAESKFVSEINTDRNILMKCPPGVPVFDELLAVRCCSCLTIAALIATDKSQRTIEITLESITQQP